MTIKSAEISMQDSLENILHLKEREQGSYLYSNFYRPRPQSLNAELLSLKDDSCDSRTKICHWTFKVIDHFNLPRETALVSMDMFDRFLATHGGEATPNFALLTAITAIFISIKVHSHITTIRADHLSTLSRDQFTAFDIEKMELEMLKSMQWLVHPPTPISFLSSMISFLPEKNITRDAISEQAQYLAELAAFDSLLIDYQASTIAFAAILSTIDFEVYLGRISSSSRETFLVALEEHADMSIHSLQVQIATKKMTELIFREQQEQDDAHRNNITDKRERDAASPTSAIIKHFS